MKPTITLPLALAIVLAPIFVHAQAITEEYYKSRDWKNTKIVNCLRDLANKTDERCTTLRHGGRICAGPKEALEMCGKIIWIK